MFDKSFINGIVGGVVVVYERLVYLEVVSEFLISVDKIGLIVYVWFIKGLGLVKCV